MMNYGRIVVTGKRPRRHRHRFQFETIMKASRLLYFTILLCLAACSTGMPIVWIERDVSLAGLRTVEILPIVDETGKKRDFDVTATIRQEVVSNLENRGFAIEDGSRVRHNMIVVACKLISYEAGSALARWTAPGSGKTQCFVKCTLTDKESGKPLGEITANRTVAAGGLYTVGYERRILSEVSEDIASELDKATQRAAGDSAR